tara:strand:+ start:129 stop:485 length:357 start_codon:yes stop_codon:yes gene_type:complete
MSTAYFGIKNGLFATIERKSFEKNFNELKVQFTQTFGKSDLSLTMIDDETYAIEDGRSKFKFFYDRTRDRVFAESTRYAGNTPELLMIILRKIFHVDRILTEHDVDELNELTTFGSVM